VPVPLRAPTEEKLPPGARRDFVMGVFDLYREAHRPTLREIVAKIKEIQEELSGTASQETVRRTLEGTSVPRRWPTAEALITALAQLADVDLDAVTWLDPRQQHVSRRQALSNLWDRAVDEEPLAIAPQSRTPRDTVDGGSEALLVRRVMLTPREHEVYRLLVAGRSNGQIAQTLHLAVGTVATHVNRIMSKLGVGSRTEAAAYAYRTGYFDQLDRPNLAEG